MLPLTDDRPDQSGQTKASEKHARLETLFLIVFAIFAVIMIVLPLGNTMELWDESRNANNAVEMVMRGHWLTPTYGFVVDHWNTKPPLLIWIIAGLERLGLAPVFALRLPSSLSALALVGVVYAFCRNDLRQPVVAVFAALILMAATLIFGPHVAMNGDYDALLCLLTTLYTLGFFLFVEPDSTRAQASAGITVSALCIILAVLDKSIAGVLLLPGLLLYAILRGRLLAIVRDYRLYLALLAVIGGIVLYYKGRDLVDPGYIAAVWHNELAGRYAKANEGHHARALFYANYLVHHFEPGILLVLLGFFTLRRKTAMLTALEARSKAAAILTFTVAIVFLLVLSKAETKIFYYCAPAVPLLSLFAALGLEDTLKALAGRRGGVSLTTLQCVATGLLVVSLVATTALGLREDRGVSAGNQAWYGQALAAMRKAGVNGPVLLLDPGMNTNAGFQAYDPVAEYYAKEASRHGMPVKVIHTPPAGPTAAWIVTCYPAFVEAVPNPTSAKDTCAYGHAAQH